MWKMTIDHDRLFKELIQNFFKEFMVLFFPEAYEAIDFEQVTFLAEEVFTDIVKGERRKIDLLIDTVMKGEPILILVHIEEQSYYDAIMAERMFIYDSRIYEKYRKRILPIVIYSYDRKKEEPDSFSWGFPFLEVLKYQFYKGRTAQEELAAIY